MYWNFILNLYIAYELNARPRYPTNNFSLKKYLFGTIKLTRNVNKSKFTYNGQEIAFDGKGFWNFNNDTARNDAAFGVDNSSSFYIDDLKYNFLVLGEGPTEGINGSDGAAEKKLVSNLVK